MAKVLLENGEIFEASSGTLSLIGTTAGTETVLVNEGAVVSTDVTIDRVEFTRNSTEYTYKATSTGIQVLFDGSVIANVQAGENLVFADGSAPVAGVFDAATSTTTYTLGGKTVIAAGSGLTPDLSTAPGETSSIAAYTSLRLQDNGGTDEIQAGPGGKTITAPLADNENTLESGDVIHGGTGQDTLKATIGNSQNFAILAETTSVETVVIQAQAVSSDTTDNNLSRTNEVAIDAQLMAGVTRWENNNSRADLLIEDVRIGNTNQVTIAMVDTDPGHVDYGVYFDQQSLTNNDVAPRELTLFIEDLIGGSQSGADYEPLIALPLCGFTVNLSDGTSYVFGNTLTDVGDPLAQAINNASTYQELVDALNAAVAADTTEGAGRFEFSVGGPMFPEGTTALGVTYNAVGNVINLTFDNSATPTVGLQTGGFNFIPNSTTDEFRYNEQILGSSDTTLITTNIELDNVGRGNMGGDLVVGGLSVGDTDDCVGIQQFNITVIRDSELQTINSTNNKLEVVNIENDGVINGDLTVTGVEQNGYNISSPTVATFLNNLTNGLLGDPSNTIEDTEIGVNTALPGTETNNTTDTNLYGDQHNDFGFNDVRVIDASTFDGDLTLTAALSDSVVAKYMELQDTAANPAADQIAQPFEYTLGNGNDTLLLAIDADNLDAAGTTTREDFDLTITGGAGDDNITTYIGDVSPGSVVDANGDFIPSNATDLTPWYLNSALNANLAINAGSGNDTVLTYGAGDFIIDLGTGADTLYTDNSGAMASWVFNTTDQVAVVAAARLQDNLVSDTNDTDLNASILDTTSVHVTFRGLEATAVIPGTATSIDFTDLELNQAIKEAINGDAVLSQLLVANDGPSNTLIVTSLIDGARVAADLSIEIIDDFDGSSFGTPVDYISAFENNGVTDIAGANSINVSDNIIYGDTGDDVIVLGTDSASAIGFEGTSNDTVVYDVVGFNADTIVNFTAATVAAAAVDGTDYLDFSAFVTGDGAIYWNQLSTDDTAAEVIATVLEADDLVAGSSIFITTDAHNVGTVWRVVDGAGAADATASIIGSIDLADTAWGTLTAENFII